MNDQSNAIDRPAVENAIPVLSIVLSQVGERALESAYRIPWEQARVAREADAKGCDGRREYFDVKAGKCQSLPACRISTYFEPERRECVDPFEKPNEDRETADWILITFGLIVLYELVKN